MNSSATVQVKVSINEDLRRFSLARNATFEQLSDSLSTLCNIAPNVPFVTKYVDCDQDVITLTCDEELREAIAISGELLRLQIKILPTPVLSGDDVTRPETPSSAPQPQEMLYSRLGEAISPFQAQFGGFGFGPRGRGMRHHHYLRQLRFAGVPLSPVAPQSSLPASSPMEVVNMEEDKVQKREEQVREWKQKKEEHKAAWQAEWKSLSKEDREKLKEQKKEMRRRWMEERCNFAKTKSSDEDEARYGALADQIEAMGFAVERKRIVRMLARNDSDVNRVALKLSRKCDNGKCDKLQKGKLEGGCKKRRGATCQ